MKFNIKSLSLLVILLFVFHSSSQEFGYLGKKNQFSFSATGNLRLSPITGIIMFDSGMLADGYRIVDYPTSGPAKIRNKIFRYDLRAGYSRLLTKRFALGFEFAYEKNKVTQPEGYDEYVYDENTWSTVFVPADIVSSPIFNCYSYMLTFEVFSRDAIAPTGWSNAFGIGPKLYSFNDKEVYRSKNNGIIQKTYSEYNADMMAINFFYQIGYKHPLTQFMTFDIGLRMHTGVLIRRGWDNGNHEYQWRKDDVYDDLFVDNMFSVLSLKMGFSLML